MKMSERERESFNTAREKTSLRTVYPYAPKIDHLNEGLGSILMIKAEGAPIKELAVHAKPDSYTRPTPLTHRVEVKIRN